MRYLSDRQLADRYSVTVSTIWRWSKAGTGFPQPVKLTGGTTRWRLDQVEAWEKLQGKAA